MRISGVVEGCTTFDPHNDRTAGMNLDGFYLDIYLAVSIYSFNSHGGSRFYSLYDISWRQDSSTSSYPNTESPNRRTQSIGV